MTNRLEKSRSVPSIGRSCLEHYILRPHERGILGLYRVKPNARGGETRAKPIRSKLIESPREEIKKRYDRTIFDQKLK